MEIKRYLKSGNFGMGLLLLGASGFFCHLGKDADVGFEKIFVVSIAAFMSILSLLVLLNPIRNHVLIKPIIWISEKVILLFYLCSTVFHLLFIPSFAFVVLCSLPIFAWKLIAFLWGLDGNIGTVQIYVSLVFAIVVFSYRGLYVLYYFQKCILLNETKYEEFIKGLTLKSMRVVDFRRRAYEIATILYIISVIERLHGSAFFSNLVWTNSMKVALEVLLTFIAIDRYIQAFLPDFAKKRIPEFEENSHL